MLLSKVKVLSKVPLSKVVYLRFARPFVSLISPPHPDVAPLKAIRERSSSDEEARTRRIPSMRVARVEHTQPRGEVIEIDVVLTVKPPLTRLERQRFSLGFIESGIRDPVWG
jgi:hypothetical protein